MPRPGGSIPGSRRWRRRSASGALVDPTALAQETRLVGRDAGDPGPPLPGRCRVPGYVTIWN